MRAPGRTSKSFTARNTDEGLFPGAVYQRVRLCLRRLIRLYALSVVMHIAVEAAEKCIRAVRAGIGSGKTMITAPSLFKILHLPFFVVPSLYMSLDEYPRGRVYATLTRFLDPGARTGPITVVLYISIGVTQ